MSITYCKHCSKAYEDELKKCPHCNKSNISIIGSFFKVIGLVFLILIVIGIFSTDSTKDNTASPQTSITENKTKEYNIGDTVSVNKLAYAIWDKAWTKTLTTNQFLDHSPDAIYLIIDVTIRNDDKEPRMIPNFKLIDETGAVYDTTPDAIYLDNSIGALETINPNVSKRGYVVFDIQKNINYKLILSGGYMSDKNAYVKLFD